MDTSPDCEGWLLEEGDRIIQKMHQIGETGLEGLTPWERLVYCLWVADYGMRNGGDLETARDLLIDFAVVAVRTAEELSLPLTRAAFAMESSALEEEYFERFESICQEVRSAGSNYER
jgi:hypothetical protein